jgi:GNAT superfamily N-acetyltransferase
LNHYSPVLLPCPYGLHAGVKSDRFGYVAGIELPPGQKPRAIQRTHEQYAQVLDDYRIGGAGVEALRDVLTLCRERGIRTAIVLTPESSEFRGWYGDAGYRAVAAFTKDVGREFDSPVFDGREWLPDAEIADGHHLTSAGAKTFTDRLARESATWLEGVRK